MDLKVGDVVQLKSGGPKMTVNELTPAQAHCVWFVGGAREGGVFHPSSLDKAQSFQ
ncbi:MAG: DUF2158 domain-containing protein [Silvibacterium sp.]